jgi:hypothetical protein
MHVVELFCFEHRDYWTGVCRLTLRLKKSLALLITGVCGSSLSALVHNAGFWSKADAVPLTQRGHGTSHFATPRISRQRLEA